VNRTLEIEENGEEEIMCLIPQKGNMQLEGEKFSGLEMKWKQIFN